MGSAIALTSVNRETGLALEAARDRVERMQGEEFLQVFRLYNPDPTDDPAGVVGPGSGFAVAGLDPAPDDPDGLVGELRFPTLTGSELREDVADEDLGMPRDLDGRNGVDASDHKDDYRLLPVEVTLRWRGTSGIRTLTLRTLLADR
jgi:hypothetical protein